MVEAQLPNIQCPQCEKESSIPRLAHKQRAVCSNCGHTLVIYHRHYRQKIFALSLSSLIFFAFSFPFNFLSFKTNGQVETITLIEGLYRLVEFDYIALAIITTAITLLFPFIRLLCLLILSVLQLWANPSALAHQIFWVIRNIKPWCMAEIFLVGTLVSLVKMSAMADIELGLSFYAFVLFAFTMTACLFIYDSILITLWLYAGRLPEKLRFNHKDKVKSLQRSWALIITAVMLYIPANLLPIMSTEFFGQVEPSTIYGGVITLWEMGSYPIAIIIFIFSIIIPSAKLIFLAWLNYLVQFTHVKHAKKLAQYYRFIEWIGRWSMIDVFVVAVLVALIQLGNTLSIYPGPAALAFCAVVIFTMMATKSFDPRMLWQHKERTE